MEETKSDAKHYFKGFDLEEDHHSATPYNDKQQFLSRAHLVGALQQAKVCSTTLALLQRSFLTDKISGSSERSQKSVWPKWDTI